MSKETNLMLLNRLGAVLQTHAAPIFKPGVKFTLIARSPGNNEGDVFVSSDELPEVEALIERSKLRDDIIRDVKPNEAAMEAAKEPARPKEPFAWALIPRAGSTVKVRAFKETEPTAEDLEFAAMEGETYVSLYL